MKGEQCHVSSETLSHYVADNNWNKTRNINFETMCLLAKIVSCKEINGAVVAKIPVSQLKGAGFKI